MGTSSLASRLKLRAAQVRRGSERQLAPADTLLGARAVGDWTVAQIPLRPRSLVLDVGSGASHLSRALAARAHLLIVLELRSGLLDSDRRAARLAGIDNVLFMRGDPAAIPFHDGSFDVVASRFGLHRVHDPLTVVREMVRACRPDGDVVLIDMADGGGLHNRLERLRDPAHTSALSPGEMTAALAAAGMRTVRSEERDYEMDAASWLARPGRGPDRRREIERALLEELAGGEPTGLRPRQIGGRLRITRRWVSLVGRRPQG